MPPDRADQRNHICLVDGKGPNGSIVMPLAGASNVGKVMRGRYLGQVGRHKPCEPELFARFVPVWDRFCHDGGRKTFGRHGPPRTEPKKGCWSEWPGECHGSRSVLSECRWSTRMGVRGHGFRGVGTVY